MNAILDSGAISICQQLHNQGFQAYLVGGCVRDLLLGETPKDYDIATDALPNQMMQIFPDHIPTGLQHGTITVKQDNGLYELTTFRIEGSYSDGRRPDEVFFVSSIEQDLARRDLTINAIAYDPLTHLFVDPFNGKYDLEIGLIKAVNDPNLRFQEDGLRIMRVARFAARFNYQVDTDTLLAMQTNLPTLVKVSKERIADELRKTLMSNHSIRGIELLRLSGVLDIICPSLSYSAFTSKAFTNIIGGELETRLALLYYAANQVLPEVCQEELINLRFSKKEIKRVLFLLKLLSQFQHFQKYPTQDRYNHFMACLMNEAPDPWIDTCEQFLTLTAALEIDVGFDIDPYCHHEIIPRKNLIINGDDMISIGIKGNEIGRYLSEAYEEVLRNPLNNNRKYLTTYVSELKKMQQIFISHS